MNLIIDIGNSAAKLALFSGGDIVSTSRITKITLQSLKKFTSGHKTSRIIVSSVKEVPVSVSEFASEESARLLILSEATKLPFRVGYETPSTLGTDRIAAVAGASLLYPGARVLVIDAGTAITYEYLDGNMYSGGNISPGIDIRFRALHNFTGKLPQVTRSESFSFPARNTTDAIVAGVITGIVYEINEYIRTFEEKYNCHKVILTGGDSHFLKDRIDGNIVFIPELVTMGLNFILEYNA